MRRTVFTILALLTVATTVPAQAAPPFQTRGARELLIAAPGDTLLPEFSYIPADTSLKLFGSRLAVKYAGIPVIFLRIYRVSRNADGSIRSKVMLSADTVSVRIGNACTSPWILTRFGDCAGDTSKVEPVRMDTTKVPPPPGDTTRAPLSTTATPQSAVARSVSPPIATFSAPSAPKKKVSTFNEMLKMDQELAAAYKKHPEIAPKHKDLPMGADNQLNSPYVDGPMPPKRVERVIPARIPVRKDRPSSGR